MIRSFRTLALTGAALVAFMALPVQAGNTTVENALRSRPELSTFYQGLISTGVINELKEGESYTVFAPTNDAFALLPPAQYPCFYSQSCKPEVAEILRNHIIPGEKHLSDIGTTQGGIMSMFAIDHEHIIASEPTRGDFTVDGHKVVGEDQLAGSMLYKVDGILATSRELAVFSTTNTAMVYVPGTTLPPRVPAGTIVTITSETESDR